MVFPLSSVKHNEPLGPLLVHDSVATLPAPDGVSRPNLVLTKSKFTK